MGIKLAELLFEDDLEDVNKLYQQGELVRVKPSQPQVPWLVDVRRLGEKSREEPKGLLLTRPIYHQYEANNKVHALTVANVRVIICIRL